MWLGDGDQITIWNENQLCHLAKASSGVTYNILQELQKFCTSILRPEILVLVLEKLMKSPLKSLDLSTAKPFPAPSVVNVFFLFIANGGQRG